MVKKTKVKESTKTSVDKAKARAKKDKVVGSTRKPGTGKKAMVGVAKPARVMTEKDGHYDLARYYLLMEKERIHYTNSLDKFTKKGIDPPACIKVAYDTFLAQETELRANIKKLIGDPQYAATVAHLCKYKGIAEWTAIIPMLFIDINRCARFGSLIKYSGLAPIALKYQCQKCNGSFEAEKVVWKNGHVTCPLCKNDQGNIDIIEGKADFYSKEGKASYNPRLKMVLLGRVAKQLVMARGVFKDRYDEYKAASMIKNPDRRPSFHHSKANRKMVRDYLFVMWTTWRNNLSLPIGVPYPGALPIRWVDPDKAGIDVIKAVKPGKARATEA